ncbi:MAG TPA: DUF2911 domain-containing protein [Chitinophagaceae bacterium]|nr:DUF2911 domain-containing protein [Chitinophagaceae bacterium]
MRKISVLACLFFASLFSFSQSARLPEVDKSPLDISYYPNNYPVLKIQNKATEPLVARVLYSRPQKQGRKIFGELVEFGKVWRLGANEATEIEFYKDVKIGGRKVPKGRYTLYAIANENAWTIIINKDTDTWGAFKYDPKRDLLRTDVNVQKTEEPVESMSMWFDKTAGGIALNISWEQVRISLPITL